MRGDAVQERPVVRDEQHAAAKGQQQVFEPADRIVVEVVGRLVQHQDVGRTDQRLRERHALGEATRQRADAHAGRQAELGDGGLHTRAQLPGVRGLQLRLQRVQPLQCGLVVRFAHRGDQRFVFGQQRGGLRHAHGDRLGHGLVRIEHRLLRHVGGGDAALARDQPIVGRRLASHDLEQRGLAGAVAADQADALAGLQRKIGVVEQRHMAKGQLRIGNGKQGHAGKRKEAGTTAPGSRVL